MTDPNILARAEPHGLGLGWLLAITLGGGSLLFMAIGLLLAWRIKRRRRPGRTTVYADSADEARGLPTRLTKRRLLETTTALPERTTSFANRISLGRPPVLPPLPTYHSFSFFRAPSHRRHRSQPWADDENDDGQTPGSRKSLRERRFSRDTWFGRARTLPNLVPPEQAEVAELQYPHGQHPRTGAPAKEMEVQRRVHLDRTHSEPLSSALPVLQTAVDDVPLPPPMRERPRAAPVHAYSWQAVSTDVDLRDILRSTEERLRENSRGPSPVKTPRSSPSKTPRSCRTPSSRAGRSTPSPTKRGGAMGASSTTLTTTMTSQALPTLTSQALPTMISQAMPTMTSQAMTGLEPSLASVGSAAESLLAHAARELELSGGLSSPGRLTGQEWEPQGEPEWQNSRSPMRSPQRSPERPPSSDSNASSSLSTLYSVGDPEEAKDQQPRRQQQQQGGEPGAGAAAAAHSSWPDPFVGNRQLQTSSWQSKPQLSGPRPLRRIKTISPRSMEKRAQTSPAAGSKPLRPISANSLHGLYRDGERAPASGRRWPVLSPQPPGIKSRPASTASSSTSLSPSSSSSEYTIGPEEGEAAGGPGTQRRSGARGAVSDSSFTTDSVHSVSEADSDSDSTQVPARATPRREWPPGSDGRRMSPASPMTPLKREHSVASSIVSSPYNEHEILSMLLSKSAPRRALPRPPTTVTTPDGSVVATALSPRPRDSTRAPRTTPRGAQSSPRPAEPRVSASGSPSRRSARDQPQTLGNTIAELRRMNSMVSSYSAASVTSTAAGRGVDVSDSPSLPSLFSGGVAGPSSLLQPRPMPRPGAIGSRHYLNIGDSPPKHRPQQHRKAASTEARSGAASRPANDRDRLLQQHQQRRDSGASVGKEQQSGKENQGLDAAKAPRTDWGPPPVPGLKNPRRSVNREMLVPLPGSHTAPLSPAAFSMSEAASPAGDATTPAFPALKPRALGGPVKNLASVFEKRIADGRQGRPDVVGRRDRQASDSTVSSDGESLKRCLRM